ncbi:MAG: NADH-quinone oxidoreductase subunit M [Bryobacter sp.]|nr:NADH-quinone oxidoreductase subunit M [Bryobacter sp.]
MADNLTLILFLPLAGGLILSLLPEEKANLIRFWANLVLGANALWLLSLFPFFNPSGPLQFTQRLPWIPSLGADYFLALDGYSLLLAAMSASLGFFASLGSWNAIQKHRKLFYLCLLALQTCVLGVFFAMDALLFFVFFEASLLPMYFLIAIWGGPERQRAAMKFLIYTAAGSMLLLLGLILLYFEHGRQTGLFTFSIPALWVTETTGPTAAWIFWLLFLGFAVKVPIAPLHTWLPDAHTEAPTAGSVYLASVLLKMGTYGFLRLVLPAAPDFLQRPEILYAMSLLALGSILYGAIICLRLGDWKRLVAYSSVSHMGFCMLGIFALNPAGLEGSMLQQINHGISTGLLFLLVGLMYERKKSQSIDAFGGLVKPMPHFALVFLIASVSSMGLPPLNGFIGEFRILTGAYEMSRTWAIVAALGIVLTVVYLLYCYQRVVLRPTDANLALPDFSPREWAIVAPLALATLAIGLYPQPLFTLLAQPARQIVEKVRPTYFAR